MRTGPLDALIPVHVRMPRCPACGSRERWEEIGPAHYACGCGDWRGRADAFASVAPVGQDANLQCPQEGHGYMHPHEDASGRWWLCAVCGIVAYPEGGPVHRPPAAPWDEMRRKAMETTLLWVPRFRRYRAEIAAWLAQGRGGGALAVFGGGSKVSNPTMDRALQVITDPVIAMIGTRLREIEAVYQSLDPLLRQFCSTAYFDSGSRPSREAVASAMGGIAYSTYYAYRAHVLDVFCDGLPAGWENPQEWWQASPLEAGDYGEGTMPAPATEPEAEADARPVA